MKDKIFYIALAVLSVMVVILWFRLGNVSDDRDRLSENQTSMIEGINNIVLTNKEMKEYIAARDEDLLKRMTDSIGRKINVSNINKYSTVVNNYRDTNIIELPIISIDNIYPFEQKDSCWGVKGYFDLNNSTVAFTERTASSKVVRVDYVKREKILKWLFGGIALGKKKAGVYVESSCGNAETMEIEVEK
jgi:hypothetical protein